jgi:hypothetical protein
MTMEALILPARIGSTSLNMAKAPTPPSGPVELFAYLLEV